MGVRGFRSRRSMGQNHRPEEPRGIGASAPSAKQARKRWAALIKQVYEVDPLVCPKCGGEMKIIGFIEKDQSEVVEKILRRAAGCGRGRGGLGKTMRTA